MPVHGELLEERAEEPGLVASAEEPESAAAREALLQRRLGIAPGLRGLRQMLLIRLDLGLGRLLEALVQEIGGLLRAGDAGAGEGHQAVDLLAELLFPVIAGFLGRGG